MKFQPTLFWILIFIVGFAPLPLGANRPIAWSFLSLLAGSMLIFWGLATTLKKYDLALSSKRILPVAIPFLAVILWVFTQLLGITPESWHHQAWSNLNIFATSDTRGSISVNNFNTATALMRLLTYGAVFWIALNLSRAPHRAYKALFAFAIIGLVYATYGLIIEFSGSQSILWYTKWAYKNDLTSTFVNRNSYATYAGLGLVVTLGLLFHEYRMVMSDRLDARKSILFIFDSLNLRMVLLIIAAPVLTSAIILTHSRAGLFSVTIGVAVLCTAYAFTRGINTKKVLTLALLVAIFGGLFFTLSGKVVSDRMTHISGSADGRLTYYKLIIDKIQEAPITGIGYGNFLDISWSIRNQKISIFWDKVHNTYLETALELGLPATFILLMTLVIIFTVLCIGLRTRYRDGIYPAIGIAVIALIGVHALVDFSIQIPAVAIGFSMILGVAYSQAWRSES